MGIISEVKHYFTGSCFTWSLATALGVKEEYVMRYASTIPECMFRAYYNSDVISDLLIAMDVEFEMYGTQTYNEWSAYIRNALSDGYKVLLLYNACKGKILTKKEPEMQSGHYVEILSVDDSIFTGRQSNIDGEKNQEVVNKPLIDLWTSSTMFDNFVVDYGKLKRCKIQVPKHEVGRRTRCGNSTCPLYGGTRCRFMCDMGGTVLVIK